MSSFRGSSTHIARGKGPRCLQCLLVQLSVLDPIELPLASRHSTLSFVYAHPRMVGCGPGFSWCRRRSWNGGCLALLLPKFTLVVSCWRDFTSEYSLGSLLTWTKEEVWAKTSKQPAEVLGAPRVMRQNYLPSFTYGLRVRRALLLPVLICLRLRLSLSSRGNLYRHSSSYLVDCEVLWPPLLFAHPGLVFIVRSPAPSQGIPRQN